MKSIYHALAILKESGRPGILCTIISSTGSTPRREGSKMLVYPDGNFVGTIGGGEVEYRVIGEALEVLNEGTPRILHYSMVDPSRGDPGICGGELDIFIDPILPQNKLVIVGGGHVGKEVASLGKWLGFHVVMCDDRQEFSNPENVPEADEYYSDSLSDLTQHIEITSWTFVVLTTRNVDVDLSVLPKFLESEAAYIGVIGSRRRWATTRAKLIDKAINPELVEKIHSPIGIDLKGETPKEIALSILAEIVKVQHNGSAKSISGKEV
jgi:xanthine dehydrogenase accessory factor